MLAIEGCLHETGVWKENGERLYAAGIPLSELITNREDTYTFDKVSFDYFIETDNILEERKSMVLRLLKRGK